MLPLVIFISLLSFFGFQSDGNWKTYSSSEGHYTIQFPGNPEESVQNSKTDAGDSLTVHIASYSVSDNEVFMSSWTDMHSIYPKDKTIQQMLEDSRDGTTSSLNATNVTTLKTNLEENPYIEFTFGTDDFVGKDRIYLINKIQYSIITIFSKATGIKPDADKFIQSFKRIP